MKAQRVLYGALALSVLYCSSSYSDTIASGRTNNVVPEGAFTWSMQNVLPKESGLVVNGVTYRYTVEKQQEDRLEVTVRNADALGDGYVFSVTDDWSGLPANTINKVVPTNIPGESWGDGEFVLEGDGNIVNPTVAYNYTWDLCYNPLLNSDCPEYFDALWQWLLDNGLINTAPDINDPFFDEWVQAMLNRETDEDEDEEESEEQQEDQEEEEEQSDLASSFFGAADAIQLANAAAEQAKLDALSNVPNFDSYTEVVIPGGVYEETVTLEGGELSDNRQALKNFAQDELHRNMVRQQYD